MAIKTNYNFKGIEVKDAYIRVDRLWGSSKEGWNSLVGVYNLTVENVPAVKVDEASDVVAQEATTIEVFNLIEEFNHSANYTEGERGYVTIYNSLKEEFGGVDC